MPVFEKQFFIKPNSMKTMYYLLKKPTLIALCLVAMCGSAFAQSIVTGKIKDNTEGTAMPGVNVQVKGTNRGAVTDVDGMYSVQASSGDVLVYSFIGYAPQEILVGAQTTIDLSLSPDVSLLGEVVVIGYGTQQKGNVTAAVASIGKEQLAGRPVADFQSSLQGQVAGLNITSNSGRPGANKSVTIRGVGSINGGNSPLYVVDGNIINNFIGGLGVGSAAAPDPLSTINPSDIESISVLKDASAAAMYGARAANGVILITTKRGKSGTPTININAYGGVQQVTNKLDLLNSQQYQSVWNTVRDNAGLPRIVALDGTTLTTSTNWQDEIFHNASTQNYDISVAGGGDKTKYFTSVGYLDQNGVVISTGLKRYSMRFNSDTDLGKFKFGNSIAISRSIFDNESTGSGIQLLNSAITSAPNVPVYNPNSIGGFGGPTPNDGEPTLNPVAAQRLVTTENSVNRMLGTVYGSYELLQGLTFRMTGNFDLITSHARFAAPTFTLGGLQIPGFETGSSVSEYFSENNSFLWENTLNYKKSFGEHNFDVLAGYTAQQTSYSDLGLSVVGQQTTRIPVIRGSNDVRSPSGGISNTRTESLIGRVIYDYASRFLFTFNFRRDGTSRFKPGYEYGNFTAASVGWNLSNEAFMQSMPAVSNLKIRASYGALGNDFAPNSRFLLNQSATYVFGNPNKLAAGVAPYRDLANTQLTWERQVQTNIGVDLGLFDNKFTFTADYFIKSSKDLILTAPVAGSTGFANITRNAGEVTNKGFELTTGYNSNAGDFKYGLGLNFTILTNTVEKLVDGVDAFNGSAFGQQGGVTRTRIEPGHSVQSFYGYVVQGVFQTQAEVDGAATQTATTAPGDFRYKDISGPDGTPDGVIDANDRTFIGNAIPKLTYGFNLHAGYKNFDLSLQFQGVQGRDIYSETKFYTQIYSRTNNLSTAVLDAWTPTNPSNTHPRAYPLALSNNGQVSSFFVEDGSYLRLKNIQLGYTIPRAVLDRVGGISNLRIYFSGQNLVTFSKYLKTGFDPEIGGNGIDDVVYPQSKIMTLGVQIGL